MQQITVGRMHFNDIKAKTNRPLGGLDKGLLNPFQSLFGKRGGRVPAIGIGQGRGCGSFLGAIVGS